MDKARTFLISVFVVLTAALSVNYSSVAAEFTPPEAVSLIVQGDDPVRLRQRVEALGGSVTHELGIIHALEVRLSKARLPALRHGVALKIYENRGVEVAGSPAYTEYPRYLGADEIHARGALGSGVTVAVLDTGVWSHPSLTKAASGRSRVLALYDAIEDRQGSAEDENGHGTHVASILANADTALEDGESVYNGVAPGVDLVVVKAFGRDGRGTYAGVLRGLDWILAHQHAYGIRIANLSFSAEPRSHYWDDPINQAVMRLWQAGIVVVTSAGNTGPDPMTVGVPGNVPYVITVGAVSDARTPNDRSDDFITSFSAAGPTYEAFVKPEVVAPGGHILGLMPKKSYLSSEHPDLHDERDYFTMSGTSQAAAAASAVAALLLEREPWLAPDDVKCRLMASALAAVDGEGGLAYSPLRHGAGLIHAGRAVAGTLTGCANQGLDVDRDLAGTEHYAGPVRVDEDGDFYIPGSDSSWNGGEPAGDVTWTDGDPWVDPWPDGDPWVDPWPDGDPWVDPWPDGDPWVDPWPDSPASINLWVDQE